MNSLGVGGLWKQLGMVGKIFFNNCQGCYGYWFYQIFNVISIVFKFEISLYFRTEQYLILLCLLVIMSNYLIEATNLSNFQGHSEISNPTPVQVNKSFMRT